MDPRLSTIFIALVMSGCLSALKLESMKRNQWTSSSRDRLKRQQPAPPVVRPVPRPGSLSRPTIRVPPTNQEQQLRQRNDVITRVLEEQEQQQQQVNDEPVTVRTEENFQEPLGLSSGAFALLGNVQSSFSCDGRPYGYYGNVENSCRIFHICLPIVDAEGIRETLQWNFFCGAETVFNQATLTCTFADDAVPCGAETEALYSVNDAFGLRINNDNQLRR